MYTHKRFCSTITFVLVVVLSSAPAPAEFSSGVSCGDVTDHSAIIWTRADQPGTIRAQVATDAAFSTIVFQVDAAAEDTRDLTLHVDADPLQPRTKYYYRFVRADSPNEISATGTFLTAPAAGDAAGFRFIISGDSNYAFAPFHLTGDAAEQDADFFIWFGDTIYADVPAGGLGVAATLDDYRQKYAQIRMDAGLREFLAQVLVLVGWDDHEVADDYSGAEPRQSLTRQRIDAAYQAFFEHLPIRSAGEPSDPFRTYRRIPYGALAEFFLLDGRQYRERSAATECEDDLDPFDLLGGGQNPNTDCIAALSRERAYLGQAQLNWILSALGSSQARYKFVVTNQPLSFIGLSPYDRWDGFDHERKTLLEFIDTNRIENVWLLSTDVHMNALSPDVTTYFRNNRPDYKLDNGIMIGEIIAGPIATDTLKSGALEIAQNVLGPLAETPLIGLILDGLFNQVMGGLAKANGWSFLAPDRFAYAMVDVSPDAGLRIVYRGHDPTTRTQADPHIYTLYDTATPPMLPCGLVPGLGLTLLAVPIYRSLRRRPNSGIVSRGLRCATAPRRPPDRNNPRELS